MSELTGQLTTLLFVLTGMMLTLAALRDDYPDYIEVMEV